MRRRTAGSARRLAGAARVAVLALLAGLVPPVAAHGQEVPGGDQLVDRQLAYDAAERDYQAALAARLVREKEWNDALELHERARRDGDEDRQNAALVHALDLSRELDLADRRASQLQKTLDGARSELLAALDDRMESVSGQLATARTPAERARFSALLRDLNNQQKQLEADGAELKVQLVYYPSIQFDVRDTPETLAAKAQLLRAKAQQADSSLAQIDREIDRIQRQQRRSRNVESLVSGLERFGDVQPPGTPNARSPQSGVVPARPDSAGVARPEQTLEQQIRQLRLLRQQVLDAKRQFLERASLFEKAIRRIG